MASFWPIPKDFFIHYVKYCCSHYFTGPAVQHYSSGLVSGLPSNLKRVVKNLGKDHFPKIQDGVTVTTNSKFLTIRDYSNPE